MRTVSQQDVSGKVVVRVAHYNFATDDASPDAIVVEKYASESATSNPAVSSLTRKGATPRPLSRVRETDST